MPDAILECLKCSNKIEDKITLYFCPKCLTQLKCKKCNSILLIDAIGCVECGEPISGSNSKTNTMNTIEFEQKGESKKFSAIFTDTVGHTLVESLSGLFLGTAPSKQVKRTFSSLNIGREKNESASGQFDDADILDETSDEVLSGALSQIFRTEDGKLRLINQRVKHTGKIDQAIRISLLLIYAYNELGEKSIAKSLLIDVLNNVKVFDANYRRWIAHCDEITKLPDDRLELSLPGFDAAKEILKEFVDPNIEKGKVQFKKVSKKKKIKKETEVDSSSGSNALSKKPIAKAGIKGALLSLINENFFVQKRKIADIRTYLKDDKAQNFALNPISVALSRLIKDGVLKREKTQDNQYEYFKI